MKPTLTYSNYDLILYLSKEALKDDCFDDDARQELDNIIIVCEDMLKDFYGYLKAYDIASKTVQVISKEITQ